MTATQKFLRLPAVMEVTGKSRTTIYEGIKAGTFPASFHIGPRAVAWDAGAIAAWQKNCTMASDSSESSIKAR